MLMKLTTYFYINAEFSLERTTTKANSTKMHATLMNPRLIEWFKHFEIKSNANFN